MRVQYKEHMTSKITNQNLTAQQEEDLVKLELTYLSIIFKIRLELGFSKTEILFKNGELIELDESIFNPYVKLVSEISHSIPVKDLLLSKSMDKNKVIDTLATYSDKNSIWRQLRPELINFGDRFSIYELPENGEDHFLSTELKLKIKEQLLQLSSELAFITSPHLRNRAIDSIVLYLTEYQVRNLNSITRGEFDTSDIQLSDEVCILIYLFNHTQEEHAKLKSKSKAVEYAYRTIFKDILYETKEFVHLLSQLKIHPNQALLPPNMPKQSEEALFKFKEWDKAILLKCYLRDGLRGPENKDISGFEDWYAIFIGSSNIEIEWHVPKTHLVAFLMDIYAATNYSVENAEVNPLIEPSTKAPQWKKMKFCQLIIDEQEGLLLDVKHFKRSSVSGDDYKPFQLFQIVGKNTSKLIWNRKSPLTATQTLLIKLIGLSI